VSDPLIQVHSLVDEFAGGAGEPEHFVVDVAVAAMTSNGRLTFALKEPEVPVRVRVALAGMAEELTEIVSATGEQLAGITKGEGETVTPLGSPLT
jgi:hypothetical protein